MCSSMHGDKGIDTGVRYKSIEYTVTLKILASEKYSFPASQPNLLLLVSKKWKRVFVRFKVLNSMPIS